MEELIDVLDENGEKTGEIETRKKVHEKGLCHRIIVVAIIDKNGYLLMQQRSENKETNAGKWDISTAGHVSSGQTSKEAAIREVSEEVGLEIAENELNYISTYKECKRVKENYIANHVYDFYIVEKQEIDINKIKMQESEVQQVKLCSIEEVKEILQDKKVVHRPQVYEELFKYLKNNI